MEIPPAVSQIFPRAGSPISVPQPIMQPYHSASWPLPNLSTQSTPQGPFMTSSQITHPTQTRQTFTIQQDLVPLPRQPVLSTLCIATSSRARRVFSTVHRFLSEIREVTIGSGSFSVMVNASPLEDSCYLEYISARNRWCVSVCPSGIPLRVVECTELTAGCRKLIATARCVFKTRESTPHQDNKPLEIRYIKSVMQSLGFCPAASGTLYRVYLSRIGRPEFIVTLFSHVDQHGENQSDTFDTVDALMAKIDVLEHESIPAVVHRLRVRDRSYGINLDGRETVKRKLSGNSSVVLV